MMPSRGRRFHRRSPASSDIQPSSSAPHPPPRAGDPRPRRAAVQNCRRRWPRPADVVPAAGRAPPQNIVARRRLSVQSPSRPARRRPARRRPPDLQQSLRRQPRAAPRAEAGRPPGLKPPGVAGARRPTPTDPRPRPGAERRRGPRFPGFGEAMIERQPINDGRRVPGSRRGAAYGGRSSAPRWSERPRPTRGCPLRSDAVRGCLWPRGQAHRAMRRRADRSRIARCSPDAGREHQRVRPSSAAAASPAPANPIDA